MCILDGVTGSGPFEYHSTQESEVMATFIKKIHKIISKQYVSPVKQTLMNFQTSLRVFLLTKNEFQFTRYADSLFMSCCFGSCHIFDIIALIIKTNTKLLNMFENSKFCIKSIMEWVCVSDAEALHST